MIMVLSDMEVSELIDRKLTPVYERISELEMVRIDLAAAAEKCGVSKPTILNWEKAGLFKRVSQLGKPYFILKDIMKARETKKGY